MSKTSALGCQSGAMREGSVLCSRLDWKRAHCRRMCCTKRVFSVSGVLPRSRQ